MSTYGMNENQLSAYVVQKLHDNPNMALDVYYNSATDKWAAVSTDSGIPDGYVYMGTYTRNANNKGLNYQPR